MCDLQAASTLGKYCDRSLERLNPPQNLLSVLLRNSIFVNCIYIYIDIICIKRFLAYSMKLRLFALLMGVAIAGVNDM